jgi:hypothetical protein
MRKSSHSNMNAKDVDLVPVQQDAAFGISHLIVYLKYRIEGDQPCPSDDTFDRAFRKEMILTLDVAERMRGENIQDFNKELAETSAPTLSLPPKWWFHRDAISFEGRRKERPIWQ